MFDIKWKEYMTWNEIRRLQTAYDLIERQMLIDLGIIKDD